MIDYPEFDPDYEVLHPSEMGWVRLADRVWEMPSGKQYIFPPGAEELIIRLRLPSDPKRQH